MRVNGDNNAYTSAPSLRPLDRDLTPDTLCTSCAVPLSGRTARRFFSATWGWGHADTSGISPTFKMQQTARDETEYTILCSGREAMRLCENSSEARV